MSRRMGTSQTLSFPALRDSGGVGTRLEVASPTPLPTTDGSGRTAYRINMVDHDTGTETTVIRLGGEPDVEIYRGSASKDTFLR